MKENFRMKLISSVTCLLTQIIVSFAFSPAARTSFELLSVHATVARPIHARRPMEVMKGKMKGFRQICSPVRTIYKHVRESVFSRRSREKTDPVKSAPTAVRVPDHWHSSLSSLTKAPSERVSYIGGETFSLGESPEELAVLSHYKSERALVSFYTANIEAEERRVFEKTSKRGLQPIRKLYDSRRQTSPQR